MDRESILNEIRRCAEANDGQPLGRARFEKVTGIRESDWAGRYWTTWNDAVEEAGFAPLSMNPAYEDDLLLGHLAALVRELDKFPTSNEIRMARRRSREFPSRNTFDRFGGKAALARRLLDYCDARDGHADVAAHCHGVIDSLPDDADTDAATARSAAGYVYLVRSGKYYKIGRTNSLGRREYELAIQLPERLELVHSLETDDAPGIERYWHERFADKRANGEWFALDRADVRAFRSRGRSM